MVHRSTTLGVSIPHTYRSGNQASSTKQKLLIGTNLVLNGIVQAKGSGTYLQHTAMQKKRNREIVYDIFPAISSQLVITRGLKCLTT